VVQSVINHSPSPQRGNLAPVTIFTGKKADSPLLSIVVSHNATPLTLADIKQRQLVNIEQLQNAVDSIHKKAQDIADERRAKSRQSRALTKGVQTPNLDIGDYVLVAKRTFHAGEKLTLRWRGPRRVVAALSDHVFEVQDLETGSVTPVHSSRLRYYHDPSLDITADLLQQIAHTEQGYAVNSIRDIRLDETTQSLFVHVFWLGFEDADATWEPLAAINEGAGEFPGSLPKEDAGRPGTTDSC
jgi:hypothetical protein